MMIFIFVHPLISQILRFCRRLVDVNEGTDDDDIGEGESAVLDHAEPHRDHGAISRHIDCSISFTRKNSQQ